MAKLADAKASKAFHYFNGVGSSPTSRKMDFRFSYYFVNSYARSAVEAWHSVPLISINLPFLGLLFRVNNWL